MTDFDPEWLDLRAPFDAAARAPYLAERLAAALGPRPRLMDIGCGSGALATWLAPILGGRRRGGQSWMLVDRDADLLKQAAERVGALPRKTVAKSATLACDLASALDALPWPETDAMVCSALLDLVSQSWLDDLAARCAAAKLPAYMTLTVDGADAWEPSDPDDETVTTLFRRHQGRDKGFGPALGPSAASAAAAAFAARGYRVLDALSPWRIAATDRTMLLAMIDGTAEAATQQTVSERNDGPIDTIVRWAERRWAQVRDGGLALRIGHRDLLALPEA